jgi:hypothetical protein
MTTGPRADECPFDGTHSESDSAQVLRLEAEAVRLRVENAALRDQSVSSSEGAGTEFTLRVPVGGCGAQAPA